jgi:hypothetical protein
MSKDQRTRPVLRIHARPGAVVSAPVDSVAITVEQRRTRSGPRLAVVLEGKRRRTFSLSFDEAALLVAQLERHLPAVTVTRIKARGGDR